MRQPAFLVLSLLVAACEGRKEDTGPEGEDTDDHDDGPECLDDGDCDDGSICEDDACEPGDRDNSVEEATVLLWSSPTEGVIEPEDDVDWYAVYAEGGEFLRVSVVTPEAEDGFDSVVSIYTASGKLLAWEDAHPLGNVSSADSMCYAYFPEAGTYYIKVEDVGTFNGVGGIGGEDATYSVEIIEWAGANDEPDSAQEAGLDIGATSVNTYYAFPVLLEEAGDTDWAVLELPDPGTPLTMIAQEHDEESEVSARVVLRNEAGDDVFSVLDPGVAAPAYLPNPLGTTYVIGVTDENGGGGADYWTWVFFVLREPSGGNPVGVEPDDDLETANALELTDQDPDSGTLWSGFGQGYVGSADDVDNYTFTVPFESAYLHAYVGANLYGSLLEPRLEIVDSTGASLGSVDSDGADEPLVNLGPYPSGTYTLRVSATEASAAEGGEGYYYLFRVNASSYEVD